MYLRRDRHSGSGDVKLPSLYERAERAAKRHADNWFSKSCKSMPKADCRLDYADGYRAGYRAAKRERRK